MNNNLDFYQYSNLETGHKTESEVYDLMKAMSAGSQTGRDLDGTTTSGSALKVESLDPTLRVLTNRDKHIVFWKMIPKEKAYNTVEEYNVLEDYGGDIGIFNTEGETPSFTDSQYKRESVLIKYMGVSGEVSHPFTLVNLGSGVGNALGKEVQNKTQYLVRTINKSLATANSDYISEEFDGVFKQHYDGVVGSGDLDTYFNDSTVIDARGKALSDANVEDAAQAVVNDNFGEISTILGSPSVFNSYVKRFHESKRINVNSPLAATTGATMGQKVNNIQTQFGDVNVVNDVFFDKDRLTSVAYNKSATSNKSPDAPTALSYATAVDTKTNFADSTGDYFYAIAAKNRFGQSAVTIVDTTAVTVSANESVDISFTYTNGSYAAESFVVYRTKADVTDYTTAKFYPIFTVSASDRTSGYDGAAASKIRDRNRFLPGTSSAIVLDFSSEIITFKQLAPMMRMDLARTSPSYRFMVLCYGTPLCGIPKRIARIVNVGTDIS